MTGHLYLNCKRNGETFALIYYYGRGETAFALNQTKSLIEYIYDHIENDYRYNVIRFAEKNGGSLASGDNNRDYAQKLFPDKIFYRGASDYGLVILKPSLIDDLKSQYSYALAKHVIIDFDNDKIKWDVFKYWRNMATFMNDPMAKSLYMDNPYSTKCYNEPIDIVPFEKMNIVEDLIINQSFALDGSKAVFAKIE